MLTALHGYNQRRKYDWGEVEMEIDSTLNYLWKK